MTKEEKAERNHKTQIQRKNTVPAAEKMRANQEKVVHHMIEEMKKPEKDLNPDQDLDPKPTRMKIVEIHQEETEIIKEVTVVGMSEIEMMIEEEIMDQEVVEIILIGIVEGAIIMREVMETMNIEEDLEAIMVQEKEEIEEMIITTMIITEEEAKTERIKIKLKRRGEVSLK
jgi:hypothetical protein